MVGIEPAAGKSNQHTCTQLAKLHVDMLNHPKYRRGHMAVKWDYFQDSDTCSPAQGPIFFLQGKWKWRHAQRYQRSFCVDTEEVLTSRFTEGRSRWFNQKREWVSEGCCGSHGGRETWHLPSAVISRSRRSATVNSFSSRLSSSCSSLLEALLRCLQAHWKTLLSPTM